MGPGGTAVQPPFLVTDTAREFVLCAGVAARELGLLKERQSAEGEAHALYFDSPRAKFTQASTAACR